MKITFELNNNYDGTLPSFEIDSSFNTKKWELIREDADFKLNQYNGTIGSDVLIKIDPLSNLQSTITGTVYLKVDGKYCYYPNGQAIYGYKKYSIQLPNKYTYLNGKETTFSFTASTTNNKDLESINYSTIQLNGDELFTITKTVNDEEKNIFTFTITSKSNRLFENIPLIIHDKEFNLQEVMYVSQLDIDNVITPIERDYIYISPQEFYFTYDKDLKKSFFCDRGRNNIGNDEVTTIVFTNNEITTSSTNNLPVNNLSVTAKKINNISSFTFSLSNNVKENTLSFNYPITISDKLYPIKFTKLVDEDDHYLRFSDGTVQHSRIKFSTEEGDFYYKNYYKIKIDSQPSFFIDSYDYTRINVKITTDNNGTYLEIKPKLVSQTPQDKYETITLKNKKNDFLEVQYTIPNGIEAKDKYIFSLMPTTAWTSSTTENGDYLLYKRKEEDKYPRIVKSNMSYFSIPIESYCIYADDDESNNTFVSIGIDIKGLTTYDIYIPKKIKTINESEPFIIYEKLLGNEIKDTIFATYNKDNILIEEYKPSDNTPQVNFLLGGQITDWKTNDVTLINTTAEFTYSAEKLIHINEYLIKDNKVTINDIEYTLSEDNGNYYLSNGDNKFPIKDDKVTINGIEYTYSAEKLIHSNTSLNTKESNNIYIIASNDLILDTTSQIRFYQDAIDSKEKLLYFESIVPPMKILRVSDIELDDESKKSSLEITTSITSTVVTSF